MDSMFPSSISNLPLLWLLLFAIMLHKGMCNLRVHCNEKDRHLLLKFRHTVVDPSAFLSTWSDERDCCEWRGVQCDNITGRVIRLNLPCSPVIYDNTDVNDKSYCLTGELHLSLLHLEFLNYLDLSNHDFHAIVQNDYVDFTNCHNLSLIEHPHYSRENSSNLHYIDLSYNENLHVDNLQWISHVSSLKYVHFRGINLQGKVDWIQLATLLPSVIDLDLEECQLENINPSLQYANFTSLKFLDLSHNAFSPKSLPHWLFNLSEVTFIDLSYNHFQGQLPERLSPNIRKIKGLYLSENKFSGPIPDWLGQLEHLQNLDVRGNLFSGPIQPTLGNLSSLTSLDARSNHLNGTLPNWLDQLEHLQDLRLSGNLFAGAIPPTLGNMSSLIALDVSSNHLNGTLPENLGQLLNLWSLAFDNNHLIGNVSERNFVKLSKLKGLYIGSPGLVLNFDSLWIPPFQLDEIGLDDMVDSKIPAWLYTQTSISKLSITNSRISFEPQDKFWDFAAQIADLIIGNNMIDGDMSNVLLNSTTITLYSNKFKGSLPRLSPNVVFFHGANNSYLGSISPLLCQKMSGRNQLKYLDISNNLLTGELTDCWMHWKSLVFVNLGNNNLKSTIPPSMGLLSNLTVLHLNKNNFFGRVPVSLKNCWNLQILDVEENKFSGSIPYWIGHNVKILQLRSNQFNGNIPLQICKLASLTILDLADNKISGSIPACLQSMTSMAFPHSLSNGDLTLGISISNVSSLELTNEVMLLTKGQRLIYRENLKFMHYIDLSSNNMSGTIPPEIFNLTELQSLNLSHNQFVGNIPKEIGNLKQLESLDLAHNQLSGEIPQSIAELSFLEALNLSFNNFTGQIPSGTQLQGFEQSYIGNLELCGDPLPKKCTYKEDVKPNEENDGQEDEFLTSFYIGLGVGFATAFWGVCGAIFLNRNFRHSYFRFLYYIRDKLYVMVVLMMNCFR